MQSKINDALTLLPRLLESANDAYWISAEGAHRIERELGAGWDPYEVWRTRIREVRNHPDRDPRGA